MAERRQPNWLYTFIQGNGENGESSIRLNVILSLALAASFDGG